MANAVMVSSTALFRRAPTIVVPRFDPETQGTTLTLTPTPTLTLVLILSLIREASKLESICPKKGFASLGQPLRRQNALNWRSCFGPLRRLRQILGSCKKPRIRAHGQLTHGSWRMHGGVHCPLVRPHSGVDCFRSVALVHRI